jgi:cation diffusion facilitator family transporter
MMEAAHPRSASTSPTRHVVQHASTSPAQRRAASPAVARPATTGGAGGSDAVAVLVAGAAPPSPRAATPTKRPTAASDGGVRHSQAATRSGGGADGEHTPLVPGRSASNASGADHQRSWRTDIEAFNRGRLVYQQPSADALRGKKKKQVLRFYKSQTELIEQYAEAEARIEERLRGAPPAAGGSSSGGEPAAAGATGDSGGSATPTAAASGGASTADKRDERDKALVRQVRFAINATFAANCVLFAIKLFASVYSGSLAVIGSTIDSSLDLISGSIIFVAARLAARSNPVKYPVGKSRLEPLSIIVFASVMAVASLQLIMQAIEVITASVASGHPPDIRVDGVALGVLVAVIAVKAGLWLLCYRLRQFSPSVDALVTDSRNDVVSNTVTVVAVVLASRFTVVWWLDSAMAIGIALLIFTTWVQTGREHIIQLTGHAADRDTLNLLTYITFNHDPRIRKLDTVRAYYVGNKLYAEVDIVLPEEMSLKEAHDIGESLQRELENLDDVERAYVHLDYSTEHRAEDEHILPWKLDA